MLPFLLDGCRLSQPEKSPHDSTPPCSRAGFGEITVDQYKAGCVFTTPERFNDHIGVAKGSEEGARLGGIFDSTYVQRVSKETAGLFPDMEVLLRSISLAGHPQAALSNACGDYVRAVVAANELDEVPGERIGTFRVALGADEVRAHLGYIPVIYTSVSMVMHTRRCTRCDAHDAMHTMRCTRCDAHAAEA